MIDKEIVDSVPSENSLTKDQRREGEKDYHNNHFGHLHGNGGNVRGNFYTTEACVPKKTRKKNESF